MSKNYRQNTDKKTTLFVGGLAYNITEGDLAEYFGRLSPVSKVVLLRDRTTGLSKGYSFVTLDSEAVAREIVSSVHVICGRRVECQIAAKKCEKLIVDAARKRKKIFISKVPASLTNEQLEAFFSQFGQIHNCYVIQEFETNNNRPFGFVEYKNADDAQRLLNSTKELYIRGHKILLQEYKDKDCNKEKYFSQLSEYMPSSCERSNYSQEPQGTPKTTSSNIAGRIQSYINKPVHYIQNNFTSMSSNATVPQKIKNDHKFHHIDHITSSREYSAVKPNYTRMAAYIHNQNTDNYRFNINTGMRKYPRRRYSYINHHSGY